MNGADVAWMLMATAMVMLMTPAGLALFYGGLAHRKSILNTIGMSYTAFCVATIAWFIAGYAIAFGEGGGRFIGGLGSIFLLDINIESMTGSIPTSIFVAFQGTFAAISVAIVSGSIVERVRYSTWLIFCFLWVIVCYAPLAHAVWGGGLLSGHGELDFAGGTVVHINAGVAGLVVALMLGARNLKDDVPDPLATKLMLLGSALLWFGWFGFNAGSALEANALAANAFLVTNIAAAVGGLSWLLLEWVVQKRRTLSGTAAGVISALVGITPAAGYVGPGAALIIGVLAACAAFVAVVYIKKWVGYDDTLDAFGIHGVAGIVGALLTAVFADAVINGEAGVLAGNIGRLTPQVIAIAATILWSAAATAVCYLTASALTGGGRAHPEAEEVGLDEVYHQEGPS